MTISLDAARQALDAQPFSRLLQAELTHFARDGIELRVPIQDELRQQNGFVHGGVISYVADNALTFAGGAALGPHIVTSEYKINYLRPALGEWLTARANAVYAGNRQAICRCEIFSDPDRRENLCAIAQGTISKIGSRNET